jgi:hypothetical protein
MTSFIDKKTAFNDAVNLDIDGKKSHFLLLAHNMELTGDPIKIPLIDQDIPYKNGKLAVRNMLQRSIQDVFKKFDVDMYNTFKNKKGIIEQMVWGCYRKQFYEKFRHLYVDMLSQDQIEKRGIEKLALERANLKRNEKIIAEQLRLGGGDLELGIKRWNKRVKEDKIVADSRDRYVSLPQELEFNNWLSSSEGKEFIKAPVDTSPKFFYPINSIYTSTSQNFKANNLEDVLKWLLELQKFSINNYKNKEISVRICLDWDTRIPFSYPTTFISSDDKLLKFHAADSISKMTTIGILGIEKYSDGWYVTTEYSTMAYKLLPPPFTDNFRSRNPCMGLSSKCYIMRRVDNAVYRVSVYFDSKEVITINYMPQSEPNMPPPPESMDVFSDSLSAVAKAQKESEIRLEKLKKDRDEKIAKLKEKSTQLRSESLDKTSELAKDLKMIVKLFSDGYIDQNSFNTMIENLSK